MRRIQPWLPEHHDWYIKDEGVFFNSYKKQTSSVVRYKVIQVQSPLLFLETGWYRATSSMRQQVSGCILTQGPRDSFAANESTVVVVVAVLVSATESAAADAEAAVVAFMKFLLCWKPCIKNNGNCIAILAVDLLLAVVAHRSGFG